jgi:glycine cleavage system transcriptional repressor
VDPAIQRDFAARGRRSARKPAPLSSVREASIVSRVTTQEASHLVLTAVGPDRPGLVRAISSVVLGAGASVEDSRMAILGGEFALIVLVSGAEVAVARVERELVGLEAELGLRFLFKRTKPEARRAVNHHVLHVSGVDRPGIVHAVTDLLAKRTVNVASLESSLTFAADSGTPLFVLEAELQVPSEVTLAELERELAELAEDENLDLSLVSRS